MNKRYKVPTHIATQDKILFGLTARQLLVLLCGTALAYQIWLIAYPLGLEHVGLFGVIVHLLLCLPPILLSLGLAFFSVADRSLEVWLLIALRYRQQPKRYAWCSVKRVPLVPSQPPSQRLGMQHPLANTEDAQQHLPEEVL